MTASLRRGRGGFSNPQPQAFEPARYGFAQNPETQGYDKALEDYNFRRKFAELQNRATDRLRGSTTSAAPTVVPGTDAMTPGHDWSGFDSSFPRGVQRNNLTINRVPDIHGEGVQTALDQASPNAGAVARATGQQQQTPYGTVGQDWQQIVVKNHPEIGIKGTQANADFVNAYRNATAQQGPGVPAVDPHALAQNVMDNIKKSGPIGPTAPTPSEIAQTDYLQSKLLPGKGAPRPGRDLAQQAMGQAAQQQDYDANQPGFFGRTAAAMMGQGPKDTTPTPIDSPYGPTAGAGALWEGVKSGFGSARDAMANLISPTPSTPALSSADANHAYLDNAVRRSSPTADNQDDGNYADGFIPPEAQSYVDKWLANPHGSAGGYGMGDDEDDVPNMASGSFLGDQGGDPYATPYEPYEDPNAGLTSKAPTIDGDNSLGGRQIASILAAGNHAAGRTDPGPRWGNPSNYARGLVPSGMKKARAREVTAIAKGVGGAKPGDKPMPINLNGRPAIVNTGEQMVATPKGTAVLNRQMQANRRTLSLR